MMAHIMERYFTNTRSVDMGDRLCESILRTVVKAAPVALENPANYDARADLMWASTVAHTDLLSCGRQGDWASHNLEHELSALYGGAHGAGLAVVFPAWMKHVVAHDPARFAQFAARVFDVEIDAFDLMRTALEGIARLERFFASIGMPVRLRELGVTDDRFEEMALKTTGGDTHTIGNFVALRAGDCVKVYQRMR